MLESPFQNHLIGREICANNYRVETEKSQGEGSAELREILDDVEDDVNCSIIVPVRSKDTTLEPSDSTHQISQTEKRRNHKKNQS